MADENQTLSDEGIEAEAGTDEEASAVTTDGVEASAEGETATVPDEEDETPSETGGTEEPAEAGSAADPKREMLKLIDLAAKYPEIGPPLAELAFKIGRPDFGNRIVRMGLDRDGPGLEYYFVAAHSARRERRYTDARKLSIEAIRAFTRTPDEELASDDGERLLHLVRLGFSTMLFDEKDPRIDPPFVEQLAKELPTLDTRLGAEAFYHAMCAQSLWYEDTDASEKAWDRAAELDTTESTWNARGTWYKDADKDLDRAERAYRKGLEIAPTSPLLLHNLGQLLVDKAERPDVDLEQARRLLRESEQHLRAALREESPKGLRRHVHATRDRLMALRASFPPRGQGARDAAPAEPEREPEVGAVLKGRVRSLTAFGAFIVLPGYGTGLLHKSEIAHAPVDDPSQVLEVDAEIEVKVIDVGRKDGKLRIGLSRRALLPKPEGADAATPPAARPHGDTRSSKPRQDQGRGRGREDRGREDQRDRQGARRGNQDASRGAKPRGAVRSRDDDKLASLGEMLLAKMNQQKKS